MFEAELGLPTTQPEEMQPEETTQDIAVGNEQDTGDGQDPSEGDEDGAEGGDGAPPKEKPFAAWEDLPKPELPKHVPYERFQSTITERNELFEDNRALAARIKELESVQTRAAQVLDPADVKIDDYDNLDDYLRARDAAVAAKITAETESRWAAKEQQRLEGEQNQRLHDQAVARFNEQLAQEPNIAKASAFFNDHLDEIPPPVARELALDPNTGFVQLRLATDKALLRQFFSSTPAEALRLINRISARIDAEREAAAPRQSSARQAPVPTGTQRAPVAKQLPTSLKPSASTRNLDLYKDADKMSLAQWRKLRGNKH